MQTTYERIREHGTREIIAANAADRIAAIRRIVSERQYAKIDGTMIDLYSASAIVQVYDALSEPNRARFADFPAGKMGLIALELVSRQRERRGA